MKKSVRLFISLPALLFPLLALSAGFIKFDGVDGESKDSGHKGWIDVISVSQGTAPRDAPSGLATGKRQHKPLTITKPIDKASPVLAKALANGTALTNVRVEVDGKVTVLDAARVTAISTDSSGAEVITLEPVTRAPTLRQ